MGSSKKYDQFYIWQSRKAVHFLKFYLFEAQALLIKTLKDFDRLAKTFKVWYSVPLDNKEHALRGWNWGKTEFQKAELTFNVQNRPAFEIPYSEVSNTNLAGKNEVAVELSLPVDGDATATTNGHVDGTRARGKKGTGAHDQLVEMRFYIPGTVTKEKKESGDEAVNDEENEEQSAASLMYNMLMEKAEIGDIAGDSFATFQDILHLTPRFASIGCLVRSILTISQRAFRY